MNRRKLVTLIFAMMLPFTMSAQSLSAMNSEQIGFTDFVTSSFINHYTTGGLQEKLYSG